MKFKIFSLSLLCFFVFASVPSYSADRSDLIRGYLDHSGVTKGLRGMFDIQAEMTIKNLSRKHNLSKEFQKDFREVWNDVMVDDFWASGGFFDMLKPIFNDFTTEELKEITNFYKSPVGKKMANLTLEMQSFIKGLMPRWEQRIAHIILPEMLKRLEEKGWDKDGNRIK